MARFAALLERSFVRIGMAGRAGIKLYVLVTRRSTRSVRLVAFLASYLDVQARQRISCFRMVELRGLLPVVHVVTTLAVVPQLPLMGIGVARQAVRRQPEERFQQILGLDDVSLTRNHFRWRVAFLAA